METVSFRLEDNEKEELKEIFEEMGLDLSTGMRLYAKRVIATRSVPFELVAKKHISAFEQSISDYKRGDISQVANTKDLMASLNEN